MDGEDDVQPWVDHRIQKNLLVLAPDMPLDSHSMVEEAHGW